MTCTAKIFTTDGKKYSKEYASKAKAREILRVTTEAYHFTHGDNDNNILIPYHQIVRIELEGEDD